MAFADTYARLLANTGRPGRASPEDEDALLRRFLASGGRLSDTPTTAETPADVQQGLAATQLNLGRQPEADALYPKPAPADVPTAAAENNPVEAAEARRAEAIRRANTQDTLAGVTEGFDRATLLISGLNPALVPIRQRDPGARDAAIRAFLAQEDAVAAQARRTQQAPLDRLRDEAELEKLKADTAKAKATAQSTTQDAAYEAALQALDSPETQALREQALAMSGGKLTPETAAKLNGLQLREALKTATSQLNAEALADYRIKSLEQGDKLAKMQAWLRQEGLDTQYNIAAMLINSRENENAEDRALREKLAQKMIEAMVTKTGQERDDKLKQLEVGGFRFAPDRIPSADSAKQMRDLAIQEGRINFSLNRLQDLYNKYGTQLYGKHAGEMESEFIAITNALRVANDMGVPNGRDYEMLAKELADPTTWKSMFTSRGREGSKFDAVRARIRNAVDTTAKAAGYEREGLKPGDPGTAENPLRTPPDTDLTQPPGASPATAPPRQTPRPSVAPPPDEIPRLVSTKGMAFGDLKKSLQEGEKVRVATKRKDGTTGYRTLQKRGDRLLIISED